VKELEIQLLNHWEQFGIEYVYKYKNRIKKAAREGQVSYELFCDLTCGALFRDVYDTANDNFTTAEDAKVSVKELIRVREEQQCEV